MDWWWLMYISMQKTPIRLVEDAADWIRIHGHTPVCDIVGFSPWRALDWNSWYSQVERRLNRSWEWCELPCFATGFSRYKTIVFQSDLINQTLVYWILASNCPDIRGWWKTVSKHSSLVSWKKSLHQSIYSCRFKRELVCETCSYDDGVYLLFVNALYFLLLFIDEAFIQIYFILPIFNFAMILFPAAWSKCLRPEVLGIRSSANFAPAMSDGARTSEPWRIKKGMELFFFWGGYMLAPLF